MGPGLGGTNAKGPASVAQVPVPVHRHRFTGLAPSNRPIRPRHRCPAASCESGWGRETLPFLVLDSVKGRHARALPAWALPGPLDLRPKRLRTTEPLATARRDICLRRYQRASSSYTSVKILPCAHSARLDDIWGREAEWPINVSARTHQKPLHSDSNSSFGAHWQNRPRT